MPNNFEVDHLPLCYMTVRPLDGRERAVFICAAGDIHGAINRFYDDVLGFEISR